MATDSGQKFIRRNRAPRVHITYDVETEGATVVRSDFGCQAPSTLGSRKPLLGLVEEAVPVIAVAATRKPVPLRLDAIGTVQPIATVVVKSRIDGQIVKVPIRDGQEVKAGDTLFVLDSRAVEAQTAKVSGQNKVTSELDIKPKD